MCECMLDLKLVNGSMGLELKRSHECYMYIIFFN